jgi:hypothetical protein
MEYSVYSKQAKTPAIVFEAEAWNAKPILTALAGFYSRDTLTIRANGRIWKGEADSPSCHIFIASLKKETLK